MSLVCEQCNGDGYIVEDVEVCPESGSAVGSCVECDCTWETIWKFPYQKNQGLDWNSNVNIKEKHREHPSVRHRNQRH